MAGNVFQQIRDAYSIADALRNHGLNLKKVGSNYELDECPFCSGHNCFRVFGDGKRWSCFQCTDNKIGKDVVDFEYYITNAGDYGSVIKGFAESMGLDYDQDELAVVALDIKNLALKYFQNVLNTIGKTKKYNVKFRKEIYDGTVWEYLTALRKHSEQILQEKQIGMSDGLLMEYLLSQGFELKQIRASGLVKNDRDLFKSGLILFPHFVNGKISHFTCKDPTGQMSPFQSEARFRDPAWRFYNQDCVIDSDVEDKSVIVLEGENDLLSVVGKGGITTCISGIGRLSDEQVKFLKTLVDRGWNLILGQDGDEEGKNYRNIIIDRVGGNIYDIPVSPECIPEGKDIDEILVDSENPQALMVQLLSTLDSDPKLYKISKQDNKPKREDKKEEIPYSLEHEHLLLRKLIRGDELDEIFSRVQDKAIFYKALNGKIFTELQDLYNRGLTINEMISYTMFRDKKTIVDDAEYDEIMLDTFTSDIDSCIDILEKKLQRRKLMEFANLVLKKSSDESIELEKVEDTITEKFFHVFTTQTASNKSVSTGNLMQMKYSNKETFKLIGTPYADINQQLVVGFDRGQMLLAAGRPGMGKSTFKTNLIDYWMKNRIGVIDFSPQNGNKLERVRLDSLGTGISFTQIWQSKEGDEIDTLVMEYRQQCVDNEYAHFQDEELDKLDTAYMLRKIRQFQKERPEIDNWVVCVDLIDKMKEFRAGKDQATKTQVALAQVRQYSKDFGFCFMPIVQIGRDNEKTARSKKKPNYRPTLDSLKGSGAYEEEPDAVFLLYRDKYYDKAIATDTIEINIAKQRGGEAVLFEKLFIGDICKIDEYAQGGGEELPPQ